MAPEMQAADQKRRALGSKISVISAKYAILTGSVPVQKHDDAQQFVTTFHPTAKANVDSE
jgi:hypothetical protein